MSDRNGSVLNPLLSVVIAILLVGGIIGGYLWSTWTGPLYAGQVVSVKTYPIHRDLATGAAMGGISGTPDVYDEVIVLASVKIKSTTKLPLFLNGMWGDLTLQDGKTQRDLAASPSGFPRVFIAYPALKPDEGQPVPSGITLNPGQELDGQLIFHYPVSEQDWNARQSFAVTIDFLHQQPLVMQVPNAAAAIPQKN